MRFVESRADGVTTLRIEGELDAVTVLELRPFIEVLLEERLARIVVDLSSLRLIDSSGVGALVSLYKRAKEYGGVVMIHGSCQQPKSIFRLLGLGRVLFA